MTFAERLQIYLDAKGWKTAELARATSIKPNTLSDLLTGKTQEPRLEILEKIVRNTDADPSFLVTGEGQPLRGPADFTEGLPREARDAVQKAVQMVEDFISVVPADKRIDDRAKKGLFVMLVADHLVAGRQDEIPALMAKLLKAYTAPQAATQPE